MPYDRKTVRVLGEIELASLANPTSALSLGVTARKGSKKEAAALDAMEVLIGNLRRLGIKCEPFLRNTSADDRPDGVRIFF
jgi:hypothetical protein